MPVEKITVPDIGGAEGAEVIELLVAVGDSVVLDQGLIVLESDKASMEIPSSVAGTVVELLVAEGDQLAEGAPVAMIDVGDQEEQANQDQTNQDQANQDQAEQDNIAPAPVEEATTPSAEIDTVADEVPETAQQTAAVDTPSLPKSGAGLDSTAVSGAAPAAQETITGQQGASESGNLYAGPAVRKLARELGVELGDVAGTGPQGRILKEDLQKFVQQSLSVTEKTAGLGAGLPPVPEIDFGKLGDIEVTQRAKLDKLTATNMHRSWLNVPHVTQFDDADITDMEEFRVGLKAEAERRDTRLTPLPFLLKACAVALRDNPRMNSSLARGGEDLVYKKYIHIGMAVDTPAGLVVPVIRDVDRKTIWELASEVVDLAARARERQLKPQDMQGGCFTISSLGNIGGSGFTPIVNTPEVGILGVSKASIKPVWDGAEFVPRKILPLGLSYDHRVVNGGDAGRYLTQVVTLLSDIRQFSL